MALYLISYDLMHHESHGQYDELIEDLEHLKARQILSSDWVIKTNADAEAIRDRLRRFMDEDDRIIVAEITSNWASAHTLFSINDLDL
jgi:CRISPR/Cas system-associated endoribonuclease Cas2